MNRQRGQDPAAIGKPTDRYGDPLPPGAIARLGTLRFRTLSRFVPRLAFSPDAKLIASSIYEEGKVCLWEAKTGKLLHRFTTKHQDYPTFSKDGKILACAGVFWNVADGKKIKPVDDPKRFLPEGKEPLPGGVLAISTDGKFQADVRGLGTIFVVDRATGKETCTFAGHDHCLWSLAFAPQGKTLATTGEDGTVRLWEPASGKLLHTFAPLETQRKSNSSVGFSPDGKILAAPVEDGANRVLTGLQAWNSLLIRRWDPSLGKELASWTTREAAAHPTLAFTPIGGTFAFDGGFGTICLWSLANGKEVRRIEGPHMQHCDCLVYSPDGKLLAAASETGLVLWEVATGREKKRLQSSRVFSAAFSPNGKRLAAGDDSIIHVWDLSNDKETVSLQVHKKRINSLAFSPDGAFLASASWDGTIGLWDVSKGKRLRSLEGHDGPVMAVGFSPDGKTLASAGMDTTVLIWDMEGLRKDPNPESGSAPLSK